MLRRTSAVFLLLLLNAVPATAQEYIWLEGESPGRGNVNFETADWGRQEFLSGAKWFIANTDPRDVETKIPEDGTLLRYPFELQKGGDFEAWVRLGYEFVRSPFRWRIDDGEWKESGPDELTTDLMAIADWTEVAWLKLGTASLGAGKHSFEIKFERRYREQGGKREAQRLLFGLDCICLSRTPFRPNGSFKPDEEWRREVDRQATANVFKLESPAAGKRSELLLGGVWQIARLDEQEIADRTGPVKELPRADGLHWKGVRVPGNRDAERPDLLYCHRFAYRTQVKVPADCAGRSFVLRFPSTALIASLLVNGRYCGFNKTPCAAWECDVTSAIKPGEVNEVCVVIKDLYYAVARTGEGKSPRYLFNVPPERFHSAGGLGLTRFADFPVLFKVRSSGILEEPSLICGGPAYTSDVFVKPSVRKQELALETTLRNATDGAAKVEVAHEVRWLPMLHEAPFLEPPLKLTVKGTEVEVPTGREKVVQQVEKWEDPELWWPDRPRLYLLITRLTRDGKVIDEKRTVFGFREWEWAGKSFKLNGVPWHLRADLLHVEAPKDPGRAIDDWKKTGQNMFRFWGERPWTGRSQEETLVYFDAHGVPVRRSGIFDGEVASYQLVQDGKANAALFDNWREQLRAWVKAERNHPSVFIWSLENEITYINARNFGWLPQVEPEIRKAAEEVMKLDPTRPVMVDGGDALRDRSLPVYGNHYNEYPIREYPDEAYTFAKANVRHEKEPRSSPWPIGEDKPLFLGESFFARGRNPGAYSEVVGESAFLGWPEANRGVARYARMLSEGYRWNDVAAFHFWFGLDPDAEHYKAWQPVCVLCREWDWTFAGGQEVKRTLKVFNEVRTPQVVTVAWRATLEGNGVAEGGKDHDLGEGETATGAVSFRLPAVAKRTRGSLTLTCRVGDTEVFHDEKPFWVLPPDGGPKPTAAEGDLVVLDPKGAVRERLKTRGILFAEAKSFEALPPRARVIVVGPDALTPRQATDPKWLALAAGGARVLILDQENPLHYQAVSADLQTTSHTGRIAFPENLDHPAFEGLAASDFFCRSGDHTVYRSAYKKASRGARSLLQCDEELSCTALVECPVGDGLLVLCQAVAGTKLRTDPVMQRLFDNLLFHCAAYAPAAKRTAVVFPAEDRRLKLLTAAGLKADRTDDILSAIRAAGNELVVADATEANLTRLARDAESLKAFTGRGGWLMLWGLAPDGLGSFNKLVGVTHVLRPFRMERVTLPAVRDPLLAGLTLRDVVLESNEKIFPWSGDRYPADNTFTHVVDLDDVAPFSACTKDRHGWSQMTNGLVSADAWKFIHYHDLRGNPKPSWTVELPREEEVTEFAIVPNTHYHLLTKLKLVFDGDAATAETLTLKPVNEKQTFALKPRRCRTLTLTPQWDAVGKQPVVGVDNVWITVARPKAYRDTVTPLLNLGALVKYRQGKGGILLNQVRVVEAEANPVNAEKKQTIVTTLLRNLGAAFAGQRQLVAGANLKYHPVPLEEKCNQFLTSDRGWLKGQPDLAHLPVGEQRFTGVSYLIRDFKTSPLPSCVMLAGPDAKGALPKSVEGIPVGRKADVLFFLHTHHPTRTWQPRNKEGRAPVLFKYVVRYADGSSADVPVRYGRGVGPWTATTPEGLPEAAVAWAAPFPTEASRQAVVYQMPWTNPKPGETIRSIDVTVEGQDGASYGVPVVLAITAAMAE